MTTARTLWTLALTGWIGCCGAVAAETLVGDRHSITVVDGDTLQVGDALVQLHGIDAPELGQLCLHGSMTWHCGLDAAYDLHKLIELSARPIRCMPEGDTALAAGQPPTMVCLDGGQDISYQLVESGIAVAAPDAASPMRRAEGQARQSGLGIWNSRFVRPWEWREGTRLEGIGPVRSTVCVVKGQTAADGARLYFTPLDDAYDGIGVGGEAGGTLFCSDEEARAAGYRRPGQRTP